jgi:hypothetical protein
VRFALPALGVYTALDCAEVPGYDSPTKTLIVHLSQDQFNRIAGEAQEGDVVVLTDGERRMILRAGHSDSQAVDLDLEQGRPELAAELLLAGKRRVAVCTREDLEALTGQMRRENHREEKAKG